MLLLSQLFSSSQVQKRDFTLIVKCLSGIKSQVCVLLIQIDSRLLYPDSVIYFFYFKFEYFYLTLLNPHLFNKQDVFTVCAQQYTAQSMK